MLLSVANLKKKEHIGCLVTFWFNTFVMIYSTAMSLVWLKNTRRWMLRSLKKGLYVHSDCLVTFWFGTFTTQLCVLLVMNTQRWIVHCYEGLFITLQFWDFGIIIILCVRAIPTIWIVRAMPQTRRISPFSQAGFGKLTASQLCIAHKSIEAYPLEASLDHSGGDQPV